MKKSVIKIQYNSPVVLTFALISLASLGLGWLTDGWSTTKFFCVYRAPLSDPLTYLRMFTHVLGHSNYSHYIGNMLLVLVVGPPLEEKYGSRSLLTAILITALISGLVQFIFFPTVGLLGASGIVFMMIVMSSLSGMKSHCIPLTLIFVVIFYLGGEIVNGLFNSDNISQLTHIVGGVCGAVIGYVLYGK
ncbi:MAG: rhomboid family intramembrane serine protease [Oscillospiraceae bacterium]